MDKQEYLEFLEAIKQGYMAGDYELVATYADQVDFKKIRDAKTLELISDAYARLNEPDNAIDALLAASDINSNSRQIAYKLCELSIQLNDLESAVEFYDEYCNLSNNASDRYILKYKIAKAQGDDISEQIKILEAYNNKEKDEKWEYELARAYHEAGKVDKCVKTCDDICLWYAGGEYVKKALELKFSHVALSPSQQRQYEAMMSEYLDPEEMTPEEVKVIEPGDIVADQLASEYLGEGQGEEQVVEADYSDVDFGSLITGIAQETQNQVSKETVGQAQEIPEAVFAEVAEEVSEQVAEPVFDIPQEVAKVREQVVKPLSNEEDDLQDTKVLSISEIVKQLDLEDLNARRMPVYPEVVPEVEAAPEAEAVETRVAEQSFEEMMAAQAQKIVQDEAPEVFDSEEAKDIEATKIVFTEKEPKEVMPAQEQAPSQTGFVLPDQKSASITMDQLRMMIHEGNRKKAESGVFFTYNEPTEEEIAEEAAQKAAREAAIEAQRLAREREIEERRLAREREIEERRKAEEAAKEAALEAEREAARKAAEEEAAREAALAAAREAQRLEEETKIEEAMRQAEEQRIIAAQNDFDTAKINAPQLSEEEIFAGMADEVADEVLAGVLGFDAAVAAAETTAKEDIPDNIEDAMADELADLFADDLQEEGQPEEVVEAIVETVAEPVIEAEAPADVAREVVEAETPAVEEMTAELEEIVQEPVIAEAAVKEPVFVRKYEPWTEIINEDGDLEETQIISRQEINERIEEAELAQLMEAQAAAQAVAAPVEENVASEEVIAVQVEETAENEPTFDDIMSDEFFQDIISGSEESDKTDFDALFGDVELSEEQTETAEETDPEVAAFLAGLGLATIPMAKAEEESTEASEELPEVINETAELDQIDDIMAALEDEVIEVGDAAAETEIAEAVEEIAEEVAVEEIVEVENAEEAEEVVEAEEEIIEVENTETAEEAVEAEITEACETIEQEVETEAIIEAAQAEEIEEILEAAAEEIPEIAETTEEIAEAAAEEIMEIEPEMVIEEAPEKEDFSSIKIDPEEVIADIALEGILYEPVVEADASEEVDEVVVNGSDISATHIFSTINLENDSALDTHMEEHLLTPEERLGAAIQRILMKNREPESVIMEETKSIRVVIPKASAGKLGVSNSRLSAHASSVIKPKLQGYDDEPENVQEQGESLRIIDNVDFSYIPIANEEDGQLGLNIDMLSQEEEYAVEGQMSIDQVLEKFNPETNKFAGPEKFESEDEVAANRLRQIQQAVNLSAPVQLPYAMDDLMFDDIEVTDVHGNAEEVEGDVFKLDLEKLGIAVSEDENTQEPEEVQTDVVEEAVSEEVISAEPVQTEETQEAEEEEIVEAEAETADIEAEISDIVSEIEASDETEVSAEAEVETILSADDLTDAEKAIAAFEKAAMESEESSDVEDEFFDVMAELEGISTESDEETELLLEDDAFDEVFDSFMSEEAALEASIPADAMNEVQEQIGYVMPESVRQGVSEFLLMDGMEASISGTICNIADIKRSGDTTGGNLIVTGEIKSGKTFLAIEVIKAVSEELGIENGKVAKVQAELLNGKNIEKVFEKISGSDLIIENVGFLSDEIVRSMTQLMQEGKFDGMVVIEGNQLAVESLFSSFPEFAAQFKNRLDIIELSIVQWADLAIKYADEKGYVLDDMAKLALHAKINEINLPTVRLGYDKIIGLVDKAIERAERRNSGKLFAAFSKKNEAIKREMIESDFI